MSDFSGGDDPILRELLPGYLARRREELSTLDEALEQKDFGALRTIGHNLHGSGGAYGLDKISEFGRELEAAAQESHGDDIRAIIHKMRTFLAGFSI